MAKLITTIPFLTMFLLLVNRWDCPIPPNYSKFLYTLGYPIFYHMSFNAGSGKHTCIICDKKFQQPSKLESHINGVHLNLKPHKCKKCTKAYSHPSNLLAHVKADHDKIRHSCDFCHYKGRNKGAVLRHIKRNHNWQLHPNKCNLSVLVG